jgi:hypothetical protein
MMPVRLSDDWELMFEAVDGFQLRSLASGQLYDVQVDPGVRAQELSQDGKLVWLDDWNVIIIGDDSSQYLHLDVLNEVMRVLFEVERWDGESGYTQLRCDLVADGVLVQYEYGSLLVTSAPEVRWHVTNPWGYMPEAPTGTVLTRRHYNSGVLEIDVSMGRILRKRGPDDPPHDPSMAMQLLGKRLLVTVTYSNRYGGVDRREQLYGEVVAADKGGVTIRMASGEHYSLPPDTRSYRAGSPGGLHRPATSHSTLISSPIGSCNRTASGSDNSVVRPLSSAPNK